MKVVADSALDFTDSLSLSVMDDKLLEQLLTTVLVLKFYKVRDLGSGLWGQSLKAGRLSAGIFT